MLTVVPDEGSGHASGKDRSVSLIGTQRIFPEGAGRPLLAMAFRLIESAPARWRAGAMHPTWWSLVRAEPGFVNRQLVERTGEQAGTAA